MTAVRLVTVLVGDVSGVDDRTVRGGVAHCALDHRNRTFRTGLQVTHFFLFDTVVGLEAANVMKNVNKIWPGRRDDMGLSKSRLSGHGSKSSRRARKTRRNRTKVFGRAAGKDEEERLGVRILAELKIWESPNVELKIFIRTWLTLLRIIAFRNVGGAPDRKIWKNHRRSSLDEM